MKNSNKSLLESKLRKMVREELGKKPRLLKESPNPKTIVQILKQNCQDVLDGGLTIATFITELENKLQMLKKYA